MGTPVVTTLTSGNLGRVAASTDGTAGIVVSGAAVGGSFALGDVLGPFKTIQEVEAVGINAAYDVTNTTNAYQHAKEFFDFANQFGGARGTGLYMMVVAKTVTMEDICDKAEAYAKKLLTTAAGKIKILGITRVPDGGYTPAYTDQLEDDLAAAIINLKALYTEEFGFHRPFQTLIEAWDWQGTVASTLDMRDAADGFTWEHGGVVLGQTGGMATLGATVTEVVNSASVGAALGSEAACSVQESIGKVKKGPATEVAPYTTDGALVTALSDSQMSTLEDQGFIFLRPHVGKAGYYWSNDANACPITSDYAYASRSRPIDKVVRLAYDVYIQDYQDDIDLDPETGKMNAAVVKSFQERIKESIAANMLTNSELSGFDAYCDPDQDVLSDDEVDVELRAVPKGRVNQVSVTVGYTSNI